MGILVKVLFVMFAVSLIISCGPIHNSAGNSEINSLGADSVEIYTNTVFPVIQNNCAACHDGTVNAAEFAVSNPEQSQNTLLSFGLIDFDSPNSSKIVTKIASGHNGISIDVATNLSLAIEDWVSQLDTSEE